MLFNKQIKQFAPEKFVAFNFQDLQTWKVNQQVKKSWQENQAVNYAQSQLQPRIREAFRKEHFDPDIYKEMGK